MGVGKTGDISRQGWDLRRVDLDSYGNDPFNWVLVEPSDGLPTYMATTTDVNTAANTGPHTVVDAPSIQTEQISSLCSFDAFWFDDASDNNASDNNASDNGASNDIYKDSSQVIADDEDTTPSIMVQWSMRKNTLAQVLTEIDGLASTDVETGQAYDLQLWQSQTRHREDAHLITSTPVTSTIDTGKPLRLDPGLDPEPTIIHFSMIDKLTTVAALDDSVVDSNPNDIESAIKESTPIYWYWLEVVNEEGVVYPLGFTALRHPVYYLYLPTLYLQN